MLTCSFIVLCVSSQTGETPLMVAASEGHVDIVRTLMEAKAQVNTQNKVRLFLPPDIHYTTHHTEFYYYFMLFQKVVCSSQKGCIAIVCVCFYPQYGCTALYLAAQNGNVDVVRLLTEAMALVNVQTKVHTLCHV